MICHRVALVKSCESGAVEQHEEGTERAEESKEGANNCKVPVHRRQQDMSRMEALI
jgi:hypothetical protein